MGWSDPEAVRSNLREYRKRLEEISGGLFVELFK